MVREGSKNGMTAKTGTDWRPAIVPALALIAIGVLPPLLKGLYEPFTANLVRVYVTFGMLFMVAVCGGLAMMVFISLVPSGIYQAWASITQGMWFARSPEVVHSHLMETLVWMRVPGDVVFGLGALFLALFAFRLLVGGTRKQPALIPVSQPGKA